MASTLTKEQLSEMTRPQLQRLCKEHNIKANLRTDQLVDLLSKQALNVSKDDDSLSSSSIEDMPPSRLRSLRKSLSQPSLLPQPISTVTTSSILLASKSTSSHTRTASKDLPTRPAARGTIPERRQLPSSLTVRSSSRAGTTDGKENGPTLTKTAKPVEDKGATVSGQSKGIASRLTTLGLARSLTNSSKESKPSTNQASAPTRGGVPRPLPSKSPLGQPEADTGRYKELEESCSRRFADLNLLIEALTDRTAQAEERAESTRGICETQGVLLEQQRAQLESLTTELQLSKEETARQVALNETLLERLEQQATRMDELEAVGELNTSELVVLKEAAQAQEEERERDAEQDQKQDQSAMDSRIQALETQLAELSTSRHSKSASSSTSTSTTKPASSLTQTPTTGSRVFTTRQPRSSTLSQMSISDSPRCSTNQLDFNSNPYIDLEHDRLAAELDLTSTPAGRRSRPSNTSMALAAGVLQPCWTTPLGGGIGDMGMGGLGGDRVMLQYNGFSRHGEDSPSFMNFNQQQGGLPRVYW